MNANLKASQAIHRAFEAYSHASNIRNSKIACMLVVILMPIGYALDYYVYPELVNYLFILRLMTSAVAGLVWVGIRQPGLQTWHYRILAMGWYLVPAFFISLMIRATDGASSTYYAGLNLVILAVSTVIQATVLESLVSIFLIFMMYLAVCFGSWPVNDPFDWRMFVNNTFFIFYTCAIVVTGNFFYNRLRFREFVLRHELDENRLKLEATNQKLLELDQVKSRFFANISHELRTPLTLLLAPLETMLHKGRNALDAKSRELLQTMHSNGMRLLKLINDLLDLVRLDSGVMQVKREAVTIADFLRGLASAARQMADDKHIRLETDVADDVGTVMLDRDKLEKIVLNLQFNALKFTAAGGHVVLRSRLQDSELILEVQDTGMGIPTNQLPHVFDRFWQADSSSRRKYQGVGIGLALVKELVEVQGGQVSVASQEGVGTTFTIRFPYQPAEPAGEPSSEAPQVALPDAVAGQAAIETSSDRSKPAQEPEIPASGTVTNGEWLANLYRRAELFPSMTAVQESVRPVEHQRNGSLSKLLIADDEPDMLRFIKSQLEDHYQILEAVDGQQAIDKTAQFLPDVVLLDMMMPEKDGLQACREIRERTSTHNIPIILLTARADEETKLAALEAGASDFLPKPFSTTELHVRIRNLVELYHFQRRLARQNHTLESTIEQLKETETRLVQSEKLASLGRLSAGIIHEINNPLNFASTGLFTLKKIYEQMDENGRADCAEILHDVEEGLSRVKTIVSDLRGFSYHDDSQCDQVPVQDLVQPSLRFLSSELKDTVRIEQDIDPDLCIWGNKNKLIQVLVNLLQNSIDAMQEKTYENEHPTLRLEARAENDRAVLAVRDNGQGIAPEHLDKIFDPFFTTKDVGEGMGLGLSISYRIIQDYDGQVSVQSEPGKYCEFRIDFPIKP